MTRNVAAGLALGLSTGIAAWIAAPLVSMARRGTVDAQTREAWTRVPVRTAPVTAEPAAPVVPAAPAVPAARMAEDARIIRARRRAAIVAGIPAPRLPHPLETGVRTDRGALAGADVPAVPDVVIPAARRSPRLAGGPAD